MDSNHSPANLDTASEPREGERVAEGNRETAADVSSRVLGGRLLPLPGTKSMDTMLDDSAKSKKNKKKHRNGARTSQPSGSSAPGILFWVLDIN